MLEVKNVQIEKHGAEIGGSHIPVTISPWWPPFLFRWSIAILPSVSYLFPGADCTAGRTLRHIDMLFLTHPCAETPQTIDRISNTHRGLDSLRPLSRPNKILASAVFDKFWFALCDRFAETLQGGWKKLSSLPSWLGLPSSGRHWRFNAKVRNQGPKLRGQVCPTKWCLHRYRCWYSQISWW
jgi:hypothetical protein